MAFEIPEGLHPDLMGLAWMLGRWEGTGKGSWPGQGDFEYGQQIDFAHNGGPYLHYLSQTFDVDENGTAVRPRSMETGFWRPRPDGDVEVVLCAPEGWAEVWVGKITGAKVELTTDAVVRTSSGESYTAGQRLYGNVEHDLLWAFDRATTEHELQPYMWARLQRAGGQG
ncbi:FABP family protein [Auraticoccus monumenti]|uniref:Ferric nitrobindin-like protein n=1 Tax=Auraticoccus monumenti TaxID=675864 RepID=A0A1G7F1L0_9ACTN|nr:FABP family protein [Auraticoccus monumenti]SDE69789.1 protein of unknown function [Auraticoccus monumenti]